MKTNAFPILPGVFSLAICLGSAEVSFGQSTITATASAGSSNISTSGVSLFDIADPYIKPIPSYAFGITYERALSDHFSMLTGAQYASRGFALREDVNLNLWGLDIPVGANIETRLNYAEVPIAVKYYLTDHGVMPYVKGGMDIAYALNGKITPRINAIIPWTLPDIPINLENDLYNRFDFAAMAGAGVSIPLGTSSALQLEVNYRHGLSDMLHEPITDFTIRSHGFSAGIGITMAF